MLILRMTKGELTVKHSRETVRRLSFWILQITGALDVEEDPNNVSFPNPKVCRELDRLKKEAEALQEKCKECHSKNPGGDQFKIPALEKGVDATQARTQGNYGSIRSVSESSEEGSCTGSRNSTGLGCDQR